MKCPKCGYNTFEYLDSCKKCGNNLIAFKESLGIRPLVLPAVAAGAAMFGEGGGQGTVPEASDDKLFQWDTPESASAAGIPEMEEFGITLGEGQGSAQAADKDPFSFDDEFDIPLSTQQPPVPVETDDPFGGFSLDDLASAPEEPVKAATPVQESPPQDAATQRLVFDDQPFPLSEDVFGTESVTASGEADDIFGGFTLEEAGDESREVGVKDLFPDTETSADDIFGEVAFDEQSASALEDIAGARQAQAVDDIFGEFSFEESSEISPASVPADGGFADIFGDMETPQGESGGAFADDSQTAAGRSDEFDLSALLMMEDEAPHSESKGVSGARSSTDDLDALFGEIDLAGKK